MKKRVKVSKLEPKSYEVLFAMEEYLATTDLSHQLRELIKIRASQINKCSYCLEMHTKDARENGETEQRIYALSAWEESPLFTDAEKSALHFTEQVTEISKLGVSDEVYENLEKHFTENQIAQMIITIGQINFWNRIAVSTRLVH
ncbi:carboxymuconolactone decarboxylase family protein [Chryseobacterium sp. R2A-55]|uniref:carboxymuconolactone decarboxylase family protein n=1 Tax=Chryseobacterium sp. R2A-55 TaxID=2744445 RepID=UPI001F3198CC|nr:carboxymuconolactone decarboxylase family protein [Chryseobacterium sp. R2A-55]